MLLGELRAAPSLGSLNCELGLRGGSGQRVREGEPGVGAGLGAALAAWFPSPVLDCGGRLTSKPHPPVRAPEAPSCLCCGESRPGRESDSSLQLVAADRAT